MLRLIWRTILGGFALALAIPFASFVLGAGLLADPGLRAAIGGFIRAGFASGVRELVYGLSPEAMLVGSLAVAKVLLLVVTVPPVLAALVGETFRFRAAAWYGGAGGVLSAALPWLSHPEVKASPHAAALLGEGRVVGVLFVTGAASGLVYWAIAGRSAGRTPPPREDAEPPRIARAEPAARLTAPDRTGRS